MSQRSTQLVFPGQHLAAGSVPVRWRRWLGAVRVAAVIGGALLASGAQAQDVIIKNDKSEISAKVIEITEDHIKYRLFDFLEGPLYNVRKTDVWMIIYEKGRREKFNVPEQTAAAPAGAAPAPAAPVANPAPAVAPSGNAVSAVPVATAAPATSPVTATSPAAPAASPVPAAGTAEAPVAAPPAAAPAVTTEAAAAPATQLAVAQERPAEAVPAAEAAPKASAEPAAAPAPAAEAAQKAAEAGSD
ncbi:hypothetical protein LJ737_14450, partial [Hymenobacter sp. 15J16-1T3B]|nr:hypothetical protein [Hymenobacter sp. 15J16-1T3B]